MKRLLLIIIVMFLILFVKLQQTKAFYGPYVYDISSITTSGYNVVIEGWAIISNIKNSAVHCVNPKYTLQIADLTTGSVLYESVDTLWSKKPSYSNPGDTSSTFFTAGYYEQYAGYRSIAEFHAVYSASVVRYHIAKAVKATGPPKDNAMYVNNHFRFVVPEGAFHEAFSDATNNRLKLNIVVQQNYRRESIFGVTFDVPSLNVTIPNISATSSVINNNAMKILNLEFQDPLTSAVVAVTMGTVQGSVTQSSRRWSCSLNKWYPYYPAVGYPWALHRHKKAYTIKKRHTATNNFIRSGFKIAVYETRFTPIRSGSDCRANNGGSMTGYLPIIWTVPGSGKMRVAPTCTPWTCRKDTDNKNLECPVNEPVRTTFHFPNDPDDSRQTPPFCERRCADEFKDGFLVLNNTYCTVRCNEKITFTFPKKVGTVISGMGFNYSVTVDGIRNCTVKRTGNAGSSSEVSTCENWFSNNNYQTIIEKGDKKLNIEARVDVEKSYVILDYVRLDKNPDNSPILKTSLSGSAAEKTQTDIYKGTYDFPEIFIRKHLGNIGYKSGPEYISGGHKFYTDFYQPAGIYNFRLNVTNIGPKVSTNILRLLPTTDRNGTHNTYGNITLSCSYTVENLDFKPSGLGFGVRQVSLTDPFPRRDPRENWKGNEILLTEKGYGIYADAPMYEFTLSPAKLLDIRRENISYSSFRLDDNEKSYFIKTLNTPLGR